MLGSTIKFSMQQIEEVPMTESIQFIYSRQYTMHVQEVRVMAADHSMRSDLHAFHINMCMQTLMSVNLALMTVTIEEWLTVMTLLVVSIARVRLATLAVEEMEHA